MSSPRASVVICAYSMARWTDLHAAVASAMAQPEHPEVILVIDHEDRLLARARARWPELRVVANSHARGLSGARNTGIEWSTGEVIAYLDDDAVAAPTWLSTMLLHFDDPTVVAVGGAAVPAWAGGRPARTLPSELLWVVGCSYRGQPTVAAEVRNVLGCSMVFRRDALISTGGFDTAAGRLGSIPLGCEETDLCIRLRQRDPQSRVMYEPRSVVSHRVSRDRMTWRYLMRRSYFEGISKSRLGRRVGRQHALATERWYVRRILVGGVARQLRQGHGRAAAAMILSLAVAGLGFARGSFQQPLGERSANRAADAVVS